MKIAFLTTDDPLYLPEFFGKVLKQRARETQGVYVVPPLYHRQTPLQAAWRYYRSFGLAASFGLGWNMLRCKFRGQSIASVCHRHGVECAFVPDVNAPGFVEELRRAAPDVAVSVSCPQIFRAPLMAVPPLGILNIHGAMLPQYRGVMPGFWMLANGETQAGVSIYFVNEQIDAGSLCAQQPFGILPRETLDQFLRRSKSISADLLLDVLRALENGRVARRPLDLSQGSYYSWPDAGAVRRFHATGRGIW
ncbi:MAG: hypothetical protein JWQ04_2236 [Pedosphaera sp.]|nr:hypothetical protein [Pedosphaera sp.]